MKRLRPTRSLRPAVALLLVVLAGCSGGGTPAHQDEGHTHAATAVTVWTDKTEVFFEYPPMIAGVSAPWAMHLTRLSDFKPVTEGSLTVRFRAQGGQGFMVKSEAPARPGIFVPAPRLPAPGVYRVIIDVESPQLTDRIDAGAITVYTNEAAVPHDEAAADAGSAISFLKEQQWPIDFGVAKVERRGVARTLAVNGTIHPAAGQMADVAAPVSGLLLAQANLRAPAPGDPVRRGQALAVIAPGGGDNSFAEAKARVERLRREVDRLQRLFDAEAIPEQRLIEARHDLEVAEAAFEAMGGAAEDGYNYTIRAPITGVVNTRPMAPGARVEAGDRLFTIVNPAVVWLRLNLPARDAAQADAITAVAFTVEGGEERFRTRRVVSVGSALDPEARTLPVTLAVDNSDRRLKIGLFAEGQAFVGGQTEGVALPNEAIQHEDGLPVAYVQTEGEAFERRPLVLGATDGAYTLVESGLNAGEYVVIKGAYQVYLASLSTSEISDHGHPH